MDLTDDAVAYWRSSETGGIRIRLCVGYVIADRWYLMQKFGAELSARDTVHLSDAEILTQVIDLGRRTYERIQQPGELTLPVYASDFGAPREYDDEGIPIGSCSTIARLVVTYTECFPMPGGRVPPAQHHLTPLRPFKQRTDY